MLTRRRLRRPLPGRSMRRKPLGADEALPLKGGQMNFELVSQAFVDVGIREEKNGHWNPFFRFSHVVSHSRNSVCCAARGAGQRRPGCLCVEDTVGSCVAAGVRVRVQPSAWCYGSLLIESKSSAWHSSARLQ